MNTYNFDDDDNTEDTGTSINNSEQDDLISFREAFQKISSIAIPMALSFTFSFEVFLIVVLINYINESEDEIASATLITVLMNMLCVVGFAPLFSMNIIASNKVGELTQAEKEGEKEELLQEKREYIAGINRNGFGLSMALTLPVVAGMVFSKPLLVKVFSQDEHIAELTQDFLRVYSIAVPALMTRISTEQMMFAFGRAKEAMVLGSVNLIIGTGLSLWLGKGSLGSKGIALGYVAETYLTSLAYALYLAKHKDFSKFEFFHIFKRFRGQMQQLKELLETGGSIATSVASEMLMALSVGVFAGVLGTPEQSSMTYINQYVFFNFLLLSGFGMACSQEVNRLIGAKQYANASRIGKYGLLTTMIYSTPIPLLFAIVPNLLIISSADQSEIENILKYLAPIMSAGVIIDSLRYNLLQQERVLNDTKTSTYISVTALTMGITSSALLGLKTSMGVYGVALGFTGGVILACPPLLYRWHHRINAEKMRQMNEAPLLSSPANSCMGFFSMCRKSKSEPIETQQLTDNEHISYGSVA